MLLTLRNQTRMLLGHIENDLFRVEVSRHRLDCYLDRLQAITGRLQAMVTGGRERIAKIENGNANGFWCKAGHWPRIWRVTYDTGRVEFFNTLSEISN